MDQTTLSPGEDRILDELVKVLPRPPDPGLSKQELLDLLVGSDRPRPEREAVWERIYDVILKSYRLYEKRQPGIPIVVNTGTIASQPRYQLAGFTGHEGQPCLFSGAIQIEHARVRRLRDLRTRATSTSEILALKYLVDIVEALDRGDRTAVRQLCRTMARESLFIIPVLSLLGQLVGVPYQQARAIQEMIGNFEKAINNSPNPLYHAVLGKEMEGLSRRLKRDWPQIERGLADLTQQLIGMALLRQSSDTVREHLNTIAQAMLEERSRTSTDSQNVEEV